MKPTLLTVTILLNVVVTLRDVVHVMVPELPFDQLDNCVGTAKKDEDQEVDANEATFLYMLDSNA